jgi:hypothetical protein
MVLGEVAVSHERGTPVLRHSRAGCLEKESVGSEGKKGRWGTPIMALHTL